MLSTYNQQAVTFWCVTATWLNKQLAVPAPRGSDSLVGTLYFQHFHIRIWKSLYPPIPTVSHPEYIWSLYLILNNMPETSCAGGNLFSSRFSDSNLLRHGTPASLGELDAEFTSSRVMHEIQHVTILCCFLLPSFHNSEMSSIYLQIY